MNNENDNLRRKKYKLVLKEGFVLYGFIEIYTDYGIWFRTQKKIAFQSFDNIQKIIPI